MSEYVNPTSRPDDLMNLLDQLGEVVATMTGFKAQYVGAGWSELHAEAMVVESLRMFTANAGKVAK